MVDRKKQLKIALNGALVMSMFGGVTVAYGWGLPEGIPEVCKDDKGAGAAAQEMDKNLFVASITALDSQTFVETAAGHKDKAEKAKAQSADAAKGSEKPDGAVALKNLDESIGAMEAALKELETLAKGKKFDAAAKAALGKARDGVWTAAAYAAWAGVLAVPTGKLAKDAITADKTCSTKLVKISDTVANAAKTIDHIITLKAGIDKVAAVAGLPPMGADAKKAVLDKAGIDSKQLPKDF